MLVVDVVYGARSRAGEIMEDEEEEEIREEGKTRLSRARPTFGMYDFEESEVGS